MEVSGSIRGVSERIGCGHCYQLLAFASSYDECIDL